MSIKIKNQKIVYEGYDKVVQYEVEYKSLNPHKISLLTHQTEIVHCPDGVMILLYSAKNDALLFVKQYRMAIYCHGEDDKDLSYPLECVAGTIDEGSPYETALREIKEEAGLIIQKLEHFATVYAAPARLTEKTYLYYGEFDEPDQIGFYGIENEGEDIQTMLIPREKVFQMMDEMQFIDALTLLALNWFRNKKIKRS